MNPLERQIDGAHYTDLKLQPLQLTYMVGRGDAVFCKVAKYLLRKKDDHVTQVEKAIHCLEIFTQLNLSTPYSGYASPAEQFIVKSYAEQADCPKLAEVTRVVLLLMLKGEYIKARAELSLYLKGYPYGG